MKTIKLFILTIACLGLVTTSSYAQVTIDPIADVIATPQFFVSLLAGVLLAIGFQVLLTSLSVAAGISAVGNVEKKAHKNNSHSSKDHSSSTPMGVKISSGMGMWTLITCSIALFFASLLAVKLSLLGNVIIGITLGLVIWAAFFTTMAYLEVKSVSTLLGSLINTAVSGIRSSASALQSMFQTSPYTKVEDIAEKTVHSIRQEMEQSINMNDIKAKIDEYVDRMEHSGPDYEQIKRDFINILKDVRIEEETSTGGGKQVTDIFVKLASEQPNLSKQDVKKLSGIFNEARQAVKSGDTQEDKAKKVAAQFTSASEEDVDQYVRQIEDYLRNTGKEELSPETIRQDIERISQDPRHARSILSNRVKQMDRSTFVALLEQNKNMNHEKAEKVAGYVEQAMDFVKNKMTSTSTATENRTREVQYGAEARTNEMQAQADSKSSDKKSQLEGKIKNYFDRMNRPELSYDSLKWDIEKIMHDPKSGFSVVRNRLNQFDRETLIALLTNNDKLSRSDVDRIATKVEETKSDVLARVEKMEAEANRRIEQAKNEAIHQAENARKTAASAAWWLFATALVSGLAAAAGGWVAII